MCVRLPCRSIIIWSICNEVLCNSGDDVADATRLHDLFHSLDPRGQRVVSANYHGWIGVRACRACRCLLFFCGFFPPL